MRRNPVYVFANGTSTGINEVPLESIIQVIDVNGAPSMTQLVNKSSIGSSTTIQQYLNTTNAYKELDRYIDNLGEISDITFGPIISGGEVLRFNGTAWVNESTAALAGDISLGDLSDVTAPTVGNGGQYLEWDFALQVWGYATPVKVINDLGDVNAAPINEQFLSYDAASSEWVAASIDGGAF